MKIGLDRLVFEVTRKCNMHCAHCLRGDAQDMDISKEIIEAALKDVSRIYEITFSGGEPTLNLPAIRYTLECCKERKIDVQSFYIVTNGLEVTSEFILLLHDWYEYITQSEYFDERDNWSGIAVSLDKYHDENSVIKRNVRKLRAFSFFREDKFIDFDQLPLIDEGRASKLHDVYKRKPYSDKLQYEGDTENFIETPDSSIYVSANGDVKTCCDASYDNTAYTIGNLNNESLADIIIMHNN